MTSLILPRAEINARALPLIEGINCDHAPSLLELGRCRRPGDQAPRLIVPSRTQQAPGHGHLHVDFRDFHYCHVHAGELRFDELVTPRLRGMIEQQARRQRPIDFRCDFEAAHIVYVSVFTPQYKYFELVKHLMPRAEAQQAWGGMIAP